jgi:VanZ family protein
MQEMKENLPSHLRFRKLWIAIGWSLVIAVIILSLIPPPIMPVDYADKIGHLIAYFVLMGWFAQIYHAPRQRIQFVIGFLLLGAVLEILQGFGGIRYAEWADMVANSAGVILAWQLTKKRWGYVLSTIERKACRVAKR